MVQLPSKIAASVCFKQKGRDCLAPGPPWLPHAALSHLDHRRGSAAGRPTRQSLLGQPLGTAASRVTDLFFFCVCVCVAVTQCSGAELGDRCCQRRAWIIMTWWGWLKATWPSSDATGSWWGWGTHRLAPALLSYGRARPSWARACPSLLHPGCRPRIHSAQRWWKHKPWAPLSPVWSQF